MSDCLNFENFQSSQFILFSQLITFLYLFIKNTSKNAVQKFNFNDKSKRKGNWSQLTF
jgi:hypothetical protein